MKHTHPFLAVILGSVLFATPTLVSAQDGSDGANQEAPPAAQDTDEQDSEASGATLDELLGLDDDDDETQGDSSAADAAARDAEAELQRELSEASISDSFQIAIQKMSLSAELLDAQFDTGLGTQRIQEDIIARLQHLIDEARKQAKQQQSSSSSSASSQAQQQQPGQQQRPGQQQQDQQQQQCNSPNDSAEVDPPPMQEGDINSVIEESRTEWGALPERVRDMLLQGRRGKFSSLYEQLTSEYYKRLAEESEP